MNELDGKVALVTGSSRGIGAAIAAHFAEHGARVAVHGRDKAAVNAVAERIRGTGGGRAMPVTADVTSYAEIEQMRQKIEQELGPVDVLVANAGGNQVMPGPLEDISPEDWRATVDGNLTATFLTVKSFLPGMKDRRAGAIITMSSAAARRPSAHSPVPYTAAKAGIQRPGRPGRPVRRPRQLHRPGDDPHRAQPAADPGKAAGDAGGHAPDPAPGHARRRGARGALLRLG